MKTSMWAARVAVIVMTAVTAIGQTIPRRATVNGGGGPDWGKCTIEVVVDGAAEVEIRGDNAVLRNLSGQPPQWRRFECTSALPPDPPNFRFTGVDGRGSQELVRRPQGGGGAVVRIQDPDGGAEGYTFDLTWGGGSGFFNPPGRDGFGGRDGRPGQRWTTEQAVRGCQEAVRQQAWDRFRARSLSFRRTRLDDNPGRRDWVVGVLDIRRGYYDRDESYRFSCSVNFDNGEVRSAQIEPLDRDYSGGVPGGDRPSPVRVAMNSCQRAVEDRLGRDGYQHVDFLSINVDDRPGRSDWIVGIARADVRLRSDTYNFACSVDLRDGDVRSVDVRRR